jgi:ATP sulfurylase
MNGPDIFSILTGIIGVSTVIVPLCQWLSPARRLRALDETMRRVEHLLATMQQEGLVAYRTIDGVQEAHERLFRCGITRVGFIIASIDHASHRVRFTLVRLRFQVATARSIFHVVRLVFSGLPFEISRLRHHLEALHDQLQVSI